MHGWLRLIMPVPLTIGSLVVCGATLQIAHNLCLLACEAVSYYQSEPQRTALQTHLARKTEIVDEVMAGRMTMRAAAAEFARLHHELPICSDAHLRNCFAPTEASVTEAEIFQRQVLAFLKARLRDLPDGGLSRAASLGIELPVADLD